MLKKHNFILLKSIFNPELGEAIINENGEVVEDIFRRDYDYEITEGGFIKNPESTLDIKKLHEEYITVGEEDDFDWAK